MSMEIKTHDFQQAKNQIQSFAKSGLKNIRIEAIKTDGFLGFGAHRATGEEVNEQLSKILSYITTLNKTNNNTIKEFEEVYNALEALDKDYTQAILGSIKASELNSEKIRQQQESLQAIANIHAKSIKILMEFKHKLDEYGYFRQIDDLLLKIREQNSISEENNENYLSDLQTEIAKLNSFISDKVPQIDDLAYSVNQFRLQLHWNDIDTMWSMVSEIKEQISTYPTRLNSIKEGLENLKKEIADCQSKIKRFFDGISDLRETYTQQQQALNISYHKIGEIEEYNSIVKQRLDSLCEETNKLGNSIKKESSERKKRNEELRNTVTMLNRSVTKKIYIAFAVESVALITAIVALFI